MLCLCQVIKKWNTKYNIFAHRLTDSDLLKVPEMFDASDGYVVISGYERPDFQQLCTEIVIYPMRFRF